MKRKVRKKEKKRLALVLTEGLGQRSGNKKKLEEPVVIVKGTLTLSREPREDPGAKPSFPHPPPLQGGGSTALQI